MTSKKTAVDPEGVARPEADDDDTEGHSMLNEYLWRDLAREREHAIERNLKTREHVIQVHAARDELKRPHRK